MTEIWKDIDGYNNLYQISNMGRVKSKRRKYAGGRNGTAYKDEVILTPFTTRTGYYMVDLRYCKERRSVSVHRLVATYFIPNPDNKETVNHKNGDKSDNRASELEWATQRENVIHSYKIGLKVGISAASHYRSRPMMLIDKKLKKTVSFPNARAASNFLGCAASSVWRYLNGERRNKKYKFLYL